MKRLLAAGSAILLCLPRPALAQTAVVTNPPVAINQCVAFTDAYGTAAVSGIGCSNYQLTISDGAHGTLTFVPSVFGLPNSPGIYNSTPGQPVIIVRNVPSTAIDAVDFDFRRNANYSTGGTFGYVNTTARFYDVVTSDRPSFEWSLLSVMDNNQAGTQGNQNVGAYFQAHKRFGTASTWAMTDELIDYNANPTAGSVTAEHDIRAVGTDNNNARVISDNFATSWDGNPAQVAYGMRFNTDANTTLKNGITFNGATISNAAIALGAGQKFCLDGLTCANYLTQASSQLHFWVNGTDITDMTAFGTASVALNATVGGIGLPAGQNLCLDGNSTCHNYLTDTSNTVHIWANSTDAQQVNSLGTRSLALEATAGGVGLPAGQKLCLDSNGTCNNYLTDTSNVVHIWANGTDAEQISSLGTTALALNATAGDVGVASGHKFCLNGNGTCTYNLTYNSGASRIEINTPSGTPAAFTGLASNLLAVTASSLDVSGNSAVASGSKFCMDGLATCSIYATYNSGAAVISFFMGGSQVMNVNSSGVVNALSAFRVGLTPTGVTCSGINAATFTSNGGIVTHC